MRTAIPTEQPKEYAPRSKKDTDNFWTLWQRKYPHIKANYYRRNCEDIKRKNRDRYHNDPEYREKCLERAREVSRRKRAVREALTKRTE